MHKTFICSNCKRSFPQDQLTELDDHFLCPDCVQSETLVCSRCGERIWSDDNAGDDRTPLCQHCYDRFYTNCESCGRTLALDAAYYDEDDTAQTEPLCWNCYTSHQEYRQIHEYSYKPSPIFYGSGNRYFGVELEIDHAGENGENACQILRKANQGQELAYCKHDGSLDNGFEIVTHPMTSALYALGKAVARSYQPGLSLSLNNHMWASYPCQPLCLW